MVLVSHAYKFVYLKTKKTASTSVEAFFEPYCLDDPGQEIVQYRGEHIGKAGIVGARGSREERRRATWHAHMSARHAFRHLGPRRWFSYFKFTTVRNPFTKTVSEFLYENRNKPALVQAEMPERRRHFEAWLRAKKLPTDRYIYAIAGVPVVQDAIRYETLGEEIARVATRIGLDADLGRLAAFKRHADRPRERAADYYTDDTRAAVARAYAPELRRYAYSFDDETVQHYAD